MSKLVVSDGSFARQELNGDALIVRVGFFDQGEWREDVAPLNGDGFDQAVLKATKRALGYPDSDYWSIESLEIYPGDIDLFAFPRESYPMYSGVGLAVCSPEGGVLSGEHRSDSPLPNRTLWMALAFAGIIREYYTGKGVEAKPFVPAKKADIA